MALLDRVKERVETDLGDVELQAMIDAVVEEIDDRFGANGEITQDKSADRDGHGQGRFLTFWRPIDTGQTLAIVEIEGADETTLQADDYRVLHGGRTLERLSTGTNARSAWRTLVKVTYTPISDAKRREEVVIQIVQLEIQARGLTGEKAGDWQANYPDLATEREKRLKSLAPRPGLTLA